MPKQLTKGKAIMLAIASVFAITAMLFFFVRQRANASTDSKYPGPAYEVLSEAGNIQIRQYSGYVVAETTVAAKFGPATRSAFRPLFAYISGANSQSNKVEMTAPVLVEPSNTEIEMTAPVLVEPGRTAGGPGSASLVDPAISKWRMSFVLPERFSLDSAPQPANNQVTLRYVEPRRIASIRFNGGFNSGNGETNRIALAKWLSANDLEHLGDWKLAGYDAPFTIPFLRRNEILVTLR